MTDAAWPFVRLAKQRLCEPEGEALFPDTAHAVQENARWERAPHDLAMQACANRIVSVERD
jgi:hypothetical protein